MSSDPIGEMRERITIQYPTKVSDGLGGFTETWVDGFTCWAKAWTVSSSESTADMQVNMIRVQKFKIPNLEFLNQNILTCILAVDSKLDTVHAPAQQVNPSIHVTVKSPRPSGTLVEY